ncbi:MULTISPECIES: NADPH-dependent F420 reductase [Rahnella]|jgi:Predicted dinucleotide-binding enzymes|uniref:NADPH-dependent F420 reductase n=1 Tax=Rahnella TaxID=34037 RepID=UPI0005692085|nr:MULTISPECIES: NAD(P)-binding domain-containing protein [Rahnella]QQN36426.1 NAD(P)-binding domain-containing protein [Rahnella aceris]
MKPIGIIGSGMIGSQVARLAVAAGVNVIISNSRGPETLRELVDELGSLARAATLTGLVAETDIIIAAIPFAAYKKLDAEELAGKIVVDTMNYYPERDGEMTEICTAEITSSELVQKHLHKSRVVRALNNMDWVRLGNRARPAGSGDRSALPVAGNDEAAKADVIALIDKLGYDAVDMGTLSESWRSEPTMPAYVLPYMGKIPVRFDTITEREWFMTASGAPVSAHRLNELLARAVRHDQMFGSTASLAGASL